MGIFFGRLKAEGFTVKANNFEVIIHVLNMIRSASAFQIIKYISKSFLDIARFFFNFMKILRSFKPDIIYLNTLKAGILYQYRVNYLEYPLSSMFRIY